MNERIFEDVSLYVLQPNPNNPRKNFSGHKFDELVSSIKKVGVIENLQREDLTELEEAQSFKIYLDKKGKDALPELAERTGIKPSYIARRMAVLTLPDKVLKAWDAGKIKYGHCEQLVRVKDKKTILQYLEQIIDDPDEMMC